MRLNRLHISEHKRSHSIRETSSILSTQQVGLPLPVFKG
jgi:hypothetical protein